ncbi:MAG: hypothetical protein ACRD6R_05375 [Candidatus Polarisedimenticolia bacterium]
MPSLSRLAAILMAALACLLGAGCANTVDDPFRIIPPEMVPISFGKDIAPIFDTRGCTAAGCHGDSPSPLPSCADFSSRPGFDLRQGRAVIADVPSAEVPGLDRVEPGDPDASYLVHKLQGTQASAGGCLSQMPLGQPPLPEIEIELLRGWIAQGALDN